MYKWKLSNTILNVLYTNKDIITYVWENKMKFYINIQNKLNKIEHKLKYYTLNTTIFHILIFFCSLVAYKRSRYENVFILTECILTILSHISEIKAYCKIY